MRSKVLIVSSDSKIGSYLITSLGLYFDIFSTSKKNNTLDRIFFDLKNNHDELISFVKLKKPDYLIWLVGKTKIEYCESNDEAFLVNCEFTINFFKKLKPLKIPIIYFSSNTVFDCLFRPSSEYDETNPLCNYGYQKELVEKFLINNYQYYSIIRITKVLTRESEFIVNLNNSILNKEPLKVFYDLYLSPISLGYINKFLLLHINNFKIGIYHLSSNKSLSYAELMEFYLFKKGIIKNNYPNILLVKSPNLIFKPIYPSLNMINTIKNYNFNYEFFEDTMKEIL